MFTNEVFTNGVFTNEVFTNEVFTNEVFTNEVLSDEVFTNDPSPTAGPVGGHIDLLADRLAADVLSRVHSRIQPHSSHSRSS